MVEKNRQKRKQKHWGHRKKIKSPLWRLRQKEKKQTKDVEGPEVFTDPDGHTNTQTLAWEKNRLTHRKIAAKTANLQGIIWYRGLPGTHRASVGNISHAKDRAGCWYSAKEMPLVLNWPVLSKPPQAGSVTQRRTLPTRFLGFGAIKSRDVLIFLPMCKHIN